MKRLFTMMAMALLALTLSACATREAPEHAAIAFNAIAEDRNLIINVTEAHYTCYTVVGVRTTKECQYAVRYRVDESIPIWDRDLFSVVIITYSGPNQFTTHVERIDEGMIENIFNDYVEMVILKDFDDTLENGTLNRHQIADGMERMRELDED